MKNKEKSPKVDDLEPRTERDKNLDTVKGGATPKPEGPIPIPYPNTSKG